jgi:hypothetical protein
MTVSLCGTRCNSGMAVSEDCLKLMLVYVCTPLTAGKGQAGG